MRSFWLCFVPIFVAVDAIGTLPLLLGMTGGLTRRKYRRVILESVVTASIVAITFLLAGRAVLRLLGVTVADFMVAGGALLFLISLKGLLGGDGEAESLDGDGVGAVPLGVPLMAGPAVMATLLLLLDQYGPMPTVVAAFVNMVLAGVMFWTADLLKRALGQAGVRTLSKVSSLVLAAFAVMIIRKGLATIIMSMMI